MNDTFWKYWWDFRVEEKHAWASSIGQGHPGTSEQSGASIVSFIH